MNEQPYDLLELGSNSLKHCRIAPRTDGTFEIETRKFPWRVAHDFFSHGDLDDAAMDSVIATLRQVEASSRGIPLGEMFNVATGVFREIPSITRLARRVLEQTGVRLRVIRGTKEAKLMARGFNAPAHGAVLLCDLGGATTEWAWFLDGTTRAVGSLKLGAIRNYLLAPRLDGNPQTYIRGQAEFCDRQLRRLPAISRSGLVVIGGTGKALKQVADKDAVSIEELRELIEKAVRDGAPQSLKPERREVFAAGLIAFERLASYAGANAVEYHKAGVTDGMAGRLVSICERFGPREIDTRVVLSTQTFAVI